MEQPPKKRNHTDRSEKEREGKGKEPNSHKFKRIS
jgi:hypothetical protein